MNFTDNHAADEPLLLFLKLDPEKDPSPSETADVPQSVDDVLRFVERYALASEPDPYLLWDPAFVGHGETPLKVERLHLGSPLEILIEIPWPLLRDGLLTGSGVWLFLAALERLWNMPKRIQVDSARLGAEKARHERDMWEARLETAGIEREYWAQRRTHWEGFFRVTWSLRLFEVARDACTTNAPSRRLKTRRDVTRGPAARATRELL